MTPAPGTASAERLLAPLRERPHASAILCDVDGTLAPIASQPDDAVVPERARAVLRALASCYGLVACVSGRRAAVARAMVGVDALTYIGNHGLERLDAGAGEPDVDSALRAHAERVREFAGAQFARLAPLGVRLEDKDSIWTFHYRGALDEHAAHAALERVAAA